MKQAIKFSKMHGLGNDFVVINNLNQSIQMHDIPIQKLGDRHIGVGFDQLLLIGPSDRANFSCRIFNSDGGEAEQCGNGMRCLGRYIHEENLLQKNSLTIETKAGIIEILINDLENIKVNMGIPRLAPSYEITLIHQPIQLFTLSMGNPHAILPVTAVETFPVAAFGPQISTHPLFPQGTNVGFMEILDRQHIRLRTYERGAGETLACGSNACAAVVSGIENKLLDSKVSVQLALGKLIIEWDGKELPVLMTGPSERVFDGLITL